MPIDTAVKRRMASGVSGLPLGPGVTPDTSRDESWRLSTCWGYRVGLLVITLAIDNVVASDKLNITSTHAIDTRLTCSVDTNAVIEIIRVSVD